MADLHAWRNAAHELPPEGVPVVGMDGAGVCRVMVAVMADDGESPPGLVWANSYGSLWHNGAKWDCDSEWDDDYTVRYWHPLPAVPTLAELDADATEDAARAMVADMAKALGGSVTWNESEVADG